MKTAGIILAGGQSRRFGTPKALAHWNGKPFITYAMDALSAADEVVTVSHLHELDPFGRREPDVLRYAGKGPLAGMLTGMLVLDAEWYEVLPCDTPRITSEIMGRLHSFADGVQAVVPVIAGRQQPLIALYHHSVKDVLAAQLQQDERRMLSFLSCLSVRYVTEVDLRVGQDVFLNVNTREEYKEL